MSFQETQRINLGLRVVIVVGFLPALFILGRPLIENPTDKAALQELLLVMLVFAAVYILFVNGKATIRIDSRGIHYRYFPIIYKQKFVPWHDITNVKIISVSALSDFGGWGYRWGKKGKGIVLAGDRAIVFSRANQKDFVITTQQEQGALRAVQHFAPEKLE